MDSNEELTALRQRLAAGEATDGQHTHRELYAQRALYHAHAARVWATTGVPVVKSWYHHDGKECFGGDFFIVVATLPTGQVSQHYPATQWDLFAVPETTTAPTHDGHTPTEADARLKDALASMPPPETPLLHDLDALIEDLADPMAHQHDDDGTDCLACIVRQRLTNMTAQIP